MAHFKSANDLKSAMSDTPIKDFMETRKPGNLNKAKAKKWVPMPAWKWVCGCTGMPGSRELGDYYLFVDPDCTAHTNIEGNFPPDAERRW